MSKLLFLFLNFVFCLCCTRLYAGEIKSLGVPYIQNYHKSVYGSGNQNWSVAQGKGLVP